jgi:hypothetical protein
MRRPIALGLALLLALGIPAAAAAHVGGVEYRFPIPVWVYAFGGALAVLGTAPAAAFAARARGDWVSRDFYRSVAPLRLGAIGLVLSSFLLLEVLVGGLWGDEISVIANPAPLLIWVDFWIGLGVVCALVGNVWDHVSPLSALARAIDRVLGRRGITPRYYPESLGVWPSVALLLVWTWMELIWDTADRGPALAKIALAYIALQLVGSAIFGAEIWLGRAELFTVFARTVSRFAPLEFYARDAQGVCAAKLCDESHQERIGCPSCWLAAEPDRRGLRLRAYGAGTRREPSLGSGGGAFVATLLATVIYDGWRSTADYARLEEWLAPDLPAYTIRVGTLTLIATVMVFGFALFLACAITSRFEQGTTEEIVRRYTPTLVPIAAVYFVAHYVLYWLVTGQTTIGTILDPFDRGWFGPTGGWFTLSGSTVWWTQVALIVWGHIVAVIEAHRRSLAYHDRPQDALRAQVPLVALMILYTFSGLWVLGQTLASPEA